MSLIDTRQKFADMLRELKALPRDEPIVLDTETTGLEAWRRDNPDRLVGISLTGLRQGLPAYYCTFRHGEGDNLPIECLAELRDFLRGREFVLHNALFDLTMLWHDGFDLPPSIQDTIVAAHLCNENEGEEQGFGLKPLSVKYLGAGADDEEKALAAELKARKLRGKGNMWRLPASLVAPYAEQDVVLTRQLYWNRHAELARWRLLPLYREVNRYLLALTRMHLRGFRIDRDEIAKQRATIGPRIEQARARIRELAGYEINVNSPVQLKKWLGIATTKKEYLLELLEATPREDVQCLLTYRELSKAESTYFDPWCEKADQHDRLHTSFSMTKVTGRISSYDPNLQQCARDQSNRPYSVRRCLTASPGCFLLEADFSTIEPRIAAHFSGDPMMQGAFLRGHDFHSAVAREMFRKAEVTNDERTSAKTLGLGVLYSLGAYKAAVKLGTRHDQLADGSFAYHYEECWAMVDGELAKVCCSEISREFCTCAGKAWIKKFYAAVPMLEPFAKQLKLKAETQRYIRNPLSGRVRRFVGKRSKPHKALNSLIQGAAADLMRAAIVALDEEFTGQGDEPRLLLTVHDSAIFEIPYGPRAETHARRIKAIMENTTRLAVPTVVDVKYGESWGNMAEMQCA